jgi:hypothetical protein
MFIFLTDEEIMTMKSNTLLSYIADEDVYSRIASSEPLWLREFATRGRSFPLTNRKYIANCNNLNCKRYQWMLMPMIQRCPEKYSLVHGYAFDDISKQWQPHTFLWDQINGVIVEPRSNRITRYVGVILSKEETERYRNEICADPLQTIQLLECTAVYDGNKELDSQSGRLMILNSEEYENILENFQNQKTSTPEQCLKDFFVQMSIIPCDHNESNLCMEDWVNVIFKDDK